MSTLSLPPSQRDIEEQAAQDASDRRTWAIGLSGLVIGAVAIVVSVAAMVITSYARSMQEEQARQAKEDQAAYLLVATETPVPDLPSGGPPVVLTGIPATEQRGNTVKISYDASTGYATLQPGTYQVTVFGRWAAAAGSGNGVLILSEGGDAGGQLLAEQAYWTTTSGLTENLATSVIVLEGSTRSFAVAVQNRTAVPQALGELRWTISEQ